MKLPFLFLSLLFCFQSWAQDSDSKVLIWVRASHLDSRPADKVIGSEELQNRSSSSLADVLTEVGGSYAPKVSSRAAFQSYSVQGSKSEHVLVLLDGVPINDISSPSGGFDYSLIDVSQLERIEVYKGSHAVRYGPQAFAGVVLLISKKPNTLVGARGLLSAATDKTGKAQITGWGSLSSETRILGSVAHDQGYAGSAAKESDGNLEVDGYQKWSSLLSLVSESFESSLRLIQFHAQNSIDYDFSSGPGGDDPNAKSSSKMFVTALSYEKVLSDQQSFQTRVYNNNFQRFENDAADLLHTSFLQSEYQSMTSGAELAYVQNNLLMGADFKYESLDTNSIGSFSQEVRKDHRQEVGFFFTPSFIFEGQKSISPGALLSCDKNHCWWQKELALGYQDFSLRLAESYRSPSFYQQFSAYGDSSLTEEKVEHASFDYKKSFAANKFTASIYQNKYFDLIDFDSVTNKYINRGRVDMRGADLSYEHLGESVSVAYLETKDLSTGRPLPRRPEWVLTGESLFDFSEKWSAGPNLRFRSRVQDVDSTGNPVYLPGALTVNFGAKYLYSSQGSVTLRWINITNDQTGDFWGYQSEQQAILLETTATL